MTGRTHDLAAFTGLTIVMATQPLPEMSLATALIAFTANMVGGLAPDLDKSTASLWKKIRAGTLVSKVLSPLMGGHRMISHSLVGVFIMGVIMFMLLEWIKTVLIVDMDVVWDAFMIGLLSHLVADGLTKEGIPLFYPIKWEIGLPPLKAMRMKTGGFLEQSIVFPGLIILNAWIIYQNYGKFLLFLKGLN